ncbi:DnaA ATPase domain-containing protein [Coralliovum pocilloporae]|uniref:DnaA ATPase domain-containing protein n=1 Tax=Coralliovum pocilloporae TaxID=3066369 RepID=UPI00330770AE
MIKPTQLTLELPHDPAIGSEDFIVAPSNSAAFELVHSWPNWPSQWVMLTGPEGCGKTHLLWAWRELSDASLVRAQDLPGYDPGALVAKGALGIEDLGEDGIDERALFHVLNAAKEANASVLMTARRSPMEWGLEIPDLLSRLRLATPVAIDEPDDGMLRAILVKHFSDRQLHVEPHVIDYLLTRMERSLGMAARVATALDRLALQRKTRITRHIAGEVLDGLDPITSE